MERQFLATLKADSGRDLAEWMEAIRQENLTHRNDIIDWLRRRGFMFSKASWLERIHHNGGKPIYGERSASRPRAAPRERREAPAGPARETAGADATVVPLRAPSATRPDPPAPVVDAARLDELLAKAKAYRPLAHFVLTEIGKVVPGVTFSPEADHVTIARGAEFAVLAVSPRELRLGLSLAGRPYDATLQAAKFPNPVSRVPPSITHMVVLTDARQVNDALMALVREAAAG
jgi:hypothetical protein